MKSAARRAWIPRVPCALLAVLVALATGASSAHATYRGSIGLITVYQASRYLDTQAGDSRTDIELETLAPHARRFRIRVDCRQQVGFCPSAGFGFSPSGAFVAAGASYSSAGRTANPSDGTTTYLDCEDEPGLCPDALFTAPSPGGPFTALAVPLFDASQPAFLPDGATIVFTGRPTPTGTANLYSVATDGSGLTQLTTAGADDPAPCGDGSILYVHDAQIWLLSARHTSSRRLTTRGGRSPDCSPDSRSFAFVRADALDTAAISGAGVRQLTHGLSVLGRPAFAPAGGEIAVTAAVTSQTRRDRGCTPFELRVLDPTGRLTRSVGLGRAVCGVAKRVLGGLDSEQVSGTAWQAAGSSGQSSSP